VDLVQIKDFSRHLPYQKDEMFDSLQETERFALVRYTYLSENFINEIVLTGAKIVQFGAT